MKRVELPNDLRAAHAQILSLHEFIWRLQSQNEELRHNLDRMCRQMYGKRSEQVDAAQLALAFSALDDELLDAGAEASEKKDVSSEEEPDASPSPTRRRRKGHGRTPLPEHLPRERRVIEPPPEACTCSKCQRPWIQIGEETSEYLEHVCYWSSNMTPQLVVERAPPVGIPA